MDENAVGTIIVDTAYKIHTRLGPGLLESVYETIMAHELRKRGLNVLRQLQLPIQYDDLEIKDGYRIDLLVQNLVIIELKSVEEIHPVYKKQLLTYLKLSEKRLGYLINFNVPLIKHGIDRVANGLPD